MCFCFYQVELSSTNRIVQDLPELQGMRGCHQEIEQVNELKLSQSQIVCMVYTMHTALPRK